MSDVFDQLFVPADERKALADALEPYVLLDKSRRIVRRPESARWTIIQLLFAHLLIQRVFALKLGDVDHLREIDFIDLTGLEHNSIAPNLKRIVTAGLAERVYLDNGRSVYRVDLSTTPRWTEFLTPR